MDPYICFPKARWGSFPCLSPSECFDTDHPTYQSWFWRWHCKQGRILLPPKHETRLCTKNTCRICYSVISTPRRTVSFFRCKLRTWSRMAANQSVNSMDCFRTYRSPPVQQYPISPTYMVRHRCSFAFCTSFLSKESVRDHFWVESPI
jgi:hypothetical protein